MSATDRPVQQHAAPPRQGALARLFARTGPVLEDVPPEELEECAARFEAAGGVLAEPAVISPLLSRLASAGWFRPLDRGATVVTKPGETLAAAKARAGAAAPKKRRVSKAEKAHIQAAFATGGVTEVGVKLVTVPFGGSPVATAPSDDASTPTIATPPAGPSDASLSTSAATPPATCPVAAAPPPAPASAPTSWAASVAAVDSIHAWPAIGPEGAPKAGIAPVEEKGAGVVAVTADAAPVRPAYLEPPAGAREASAASSTSGRDQGARASALPDPSVEGAAATDVRSPAGLASCDSEQVAERPVAGPNTGPLAENGHQGAPASESIGSGLDAPAASATAVVAGAGVDSPPALQDPQVSSGAAAVVAVPAAAASIPLAPVLRMPDSPAGAASVAPSSSDASAGAGETPPAAHAPVSPAAVIRERFWKLKESRIRMHGPSPNTRASSIGDPCERRLVYERTVPAAMRIAHGPALQAIFDLGKLIERFVVVPELEEMGIEIVQRERDYVDPELEFSGHVDAMLRVPGVEELVPAEIKGINPFLAGRIETIADIRDHKDAWVRKYFAQLQAYLYHTRKPIGVFVLFDKSAGVQNPIDCPRDERFIESLKAKAARIRDAVRAGTLPERAPSRDCERCPFLALCGPDETWREGVIVATLPELASMLRLREALEPTADHFVELDAAVKKVLSEIAKPEVLVEDFVARGTRVEPKGKKPYWRWEVERLTNANAEG